MKFLASALLVLVLGLRVAARDDKAVNTWSTAASMPTTRFGLAAVTVDGKIYAIGGTSSFHDRTGSYGKAINTVEVYDPVTNTWSTAVFMPKAGSDLAAVTVNEKIYVIGDRRLDVFDLTTSSWSTAAPMPSARSSRAVASVNGKIFAIGGCSRFDPVNTVEVYDPATNTWSTAAPMPSPRCSFAVATVNGKIYAIGGAPGIPQPLKGNTYGFDGGGLEATVEVYDPATNTWSTAAPMPTARYSLASVTVNGKIYAIGGEVAGPPLKVKGKIYPTIGAAVNTVEVYDPATNTWSTAAHMPTARCSLAVATVNDNLYAIGGANGSVYLNTVEALPVRPGSTNRGESGVQPPHSKKEPAGSRRYEMRGRP